MEEINLLGEKNKKIWMLYNTARIAVYMGSITVLAILIFAGALFAYNKKLSESLSITKNSISTFQKTELKQEEKIKEEAKKINAKIYFMDDLLENHKEISLAIKELSSIFPSGISISSIELRLIGDKYISVIKGSSLTRADFLKLQSLMEKNPNFSNIKSPLSNITKKENIDFIITSDISI